MKTWKRALTTKRSNCVTREHGTIKRVKSKVVLLTKSTFAIAHLACDLCNPMDHPDADRYCKHGLKCVIYTSKKEPGRRFYRCPKPINDPARCEFFLWLDEAQPLSSPNTGSQLPPTPQSALLSSSASREPLTPSPAARKRFDVGSASSPSQKRVNLFEVARTRYDEEGQYSPSSFLHSPDIGSQGSQETFTGEDNEELSATSIEKLFRSLGNIPAYVKHLERRKITAERSRDAKTHKIIFLEGEVERLKQREKELEEVVAILECAN